MKNNKQKNRKLSMLFIIGIIMIIIVALYISVIFIVGDGKMEITEYHPFKSEAAKKKCLSAFTAMEKAQWPVSSEKKYVETSFGKTFVRISGPKDGPPLVLLHGNGGNSLMWSDSIKALSEKYRTYAVDRIDDFGLSVRSKDLNKPEEYVDWLDELFTNLKLGKDINIVGISFGAWLIGQYALHHQNRLNKIVIISPASTIQPITKQFYIRAFLSVLPFRYFTKSFSSWLLEDLEKSKKSDFEKAVDFTYLLLRSYKIARSVNPTVLDDSELQRINIPAMVLIGENEKIYSARKAIERLNRVASHINKEMIPGAGHDLASVKADLVNKKVLEFLADKRSDPKHIKGGSMAMKTQNANDIKETFAIKDAKIFDGLRVLTENDILIEDGKIAEIAHTLDVSDDVPIIDGTGLIGKISRIMC